MAIGLRRKSNGIVFSPNRAYGTGLTHNQKLKRLGPIKSSFPREIKHEGSLSTLLCAFPLPTPRRALEVNPQNFRLAPSACREKHTGEIGCHYDAPENHDRVAAQGSRKWVNRPGLLMGRLGPGEEL